MTQIEKNITSNEQASTARSPVDNPGALSAHRSMPINSPVHEIMGLGWSGNGPWTRGHDASIHIPEAPKDLQILNVSHTKIITNGGNEIENFGMIPPLTKPNQSCLSVCLSVRLSDEIMVFPIRGMTWYFAWSYNYVNPWTHVTTIFEFFGKSNSFVGRFFVGYDNLEYDEFEFYATPCENRMSAKILILEINTDPSCNRFGGSLLPIFPNISFKWQVVMINFQVRRWSKHLPGLIHIILKKRNSIIV